MNPKRIAGYVNLLAAVVFIATGIAQHRNTLIGLGVLFLAIGVVRLRTTPPGPPPA